MEEFKKEKIAQIKKSLIEKILTHAVNTYGTAAIHSAWQDFHPLEECGPFDPHSIEIPLFMPWFFYKWYPSENSKGPRMPPAASLLGSDASLGQEEKMYLISCLQNSFSFFEVDFVIPGKSIQFTDLFTDKKYEVIEYIASQGLTKGSLIFGMIIAFNGIEILEAMCPRPFSNKDKFKVLKVRKFIHDKHKVIDNKILYYGVSELLELYNELEGGQPEPSSFLDYDFLGLSPSDIHNLLYKPFSLDNEIFRFSISDHCNYKESPFLNQAIFILKKMEETGSLKATQKGFFPRSLVQEMYKKFFMDQYSFLNPQKEDDLFEMTMLRTILTSSRMIQKRNGKFLLTKKGEKILKESTDDVLYQEFLSTAIVGWNWAFGDLYPEMPLIQQSVIFNLYLLSKCAQDWISEEELGRIYIKAFPAILRHASSKYWAPEVEVANCFSVRFLIRFCIPFGILTTKEEGKRVLGEKQLFKVTALFQKAFIFKV